MMKALFRPAALLIAGSFLLAGAGRPLHAQPVGSEFRVSTFTTENQSVGFLGGDEGGVAIDSAGNFVVVWSGYGQGVVLGGEGILGQRFASSGAPLGPEFRVNTTTTGVVRPSVASGAGGGFIVVWCGDQSPTRGTFGQRFSSSGAPLGPEFRVASYTGTFSYSISPHVASDPAGNFVVVWDGVAEGSSYLATSVQARRYSSSGEALDAQPFQVSQETTGGQSPAVVAMDSAGNFVVGWSRQNGAQSFGRRFSSSGAPLGSEFQLAGADSVAFDAAGNFAVVFTDGLNALAQRYSSAGAPLGTALRLNTYTSYQPTGPRIARASSGIYVVTWSAHQPSPETWEVRGRRFSSAGVLLDPEFQVNEYTKDEQFSSKIAANSAGKFVIAWTSYEQPPDLSGESVWARRFLSVPFLSGDVDGNGVVNVSDVLYLINTLFAGGPPPIGNANANGDGSVNVSDILYLINYLFAGGPAPL